MVKYLFILTTFLFTNENVTSISGSVYDDEGHPIESVEIRDDNFSIGALTDSKGAFVIIFTDKSSDTLLFSHIGYNKAIYSIEDILNMKNNIILSQSSIKKSEIIISSLRKNIQIKESPILTHIIDEDEIKLTSSSNTKELIQSALPNVQIVHDNHGDNGIKIQGYNSNNIAFLIDGIRVYGEFAGNIDFTMFDSEDISRVEVIRGGMSTLYGSGAIGGVVNFITKHRENSIWSKFEVINDAPLITTKFFNFGFNYKNFQYSILLNENHSDGYDLTPLDGAGDIEKTLEMYSSISFSQKFIYKINSQNKLSLKCSNYVKDISKYALDLGISLDENNNVIEDSSIVLQRVIPSYRDQSFSINYQKINNKNSHLSLSYYMEKYVKIYNYPYYYGEFPVNPSKESFEWSIPSTHNVNTVFSFKIKSHSFLIGAEYIYRRYISRDIPSSGYVDDEELNEHSIFGLDSLKEFTESSFFVSDTFDLKLAMITLGTRYSYNSVYGQTISPSFATKYKLHHNILRFNYSHNFRSPSLKELYYEMEQHSPAVYGNPHLKPQTSNHYSLSVESIKGVNNSFEVYASQNYNMINYRSITEINELDTTSYLMSDNYLDILLYGLNINKKINFSDKFSIKNIYSYTSATSKSDETLDGISKHSVKIQMQYHVHNKLQLLFSTKYSSEKYWQDIILEGYSTSDLLFVWDASAYTFIKFGVKNIFDYIDSRSTELGSDILSNYDPGRRFFMQIALNFNNEIK